MRAAGSHRAAALFYVGTGSGFGGGVFWDGPELASLGTGPFLAISG